MNKKIVLLCVFGALLLSSAVYAQNYTGKSLGVYAPKGKLPSGDQNLPLVIQSYFSDILRTYSTMDVQNMSTWEDKMMAIEAKSASGARDTVSEALPEYSLNGTITPISSGFTLYIEIIRDVAGAKPITHTANYTKKDIEERIAVNKATLDLLGKMGVTLTVQARDALQQAADQRTIDARTTLTDGIIADRNNDTTKARMLYYQAQEIDPSLMEAATRASIVTANIRTGNIGQDMRNDVQWGKEWEARLAETERYFDTWFKNFNQPYALIYTPELKTGTIDTINRRDNTNWVSFTVELRERSNWTNPVLKTVNAVWQDLNATGRKTAWGLESWPQYKSPFSDGSKRLTIVVELLNAQKKVIGRETFEVRGRWNFSFSRDVGIRSFTSSGEAAKTITFRAVKLDDWTDGMTLQFTTVNNVPVADASKNGVLLITTRAAYRDAAGFNYDGGGYSWDGYDKEGYKDGYDRDGYDREDFNREGYNRDPAGYGRDGYNREGYDKKGFNRDGYDRRGFNKDSYTIDGSLYDKEGYDKTGYNAEGFDTAGYDRNGYDKKGYGSDGYNSLGFHRGYRWSPLSSYFEALYTFRPESVGGFTVGLFGVYGSFSFFEVESGAPTVTDDGKTEYHYDYSLGEFVVGYTLNLLLFGKGWLGLGLPLGIGRNNLENQLVMETGLQLRFPFLIVGTAEIRGTYRTIGFSDNSVTLSVGLFVPSAGKSLWHPDGK